MSQTVGDVAQVFYITDDDPVWDAEKSMFFSITPDGAMHDYFVDLGSSVDTTGVITQLRLDPTIEAGSDMAIDFVRLTDSNHVQQPPPTAPLPAPQQVQFVSIGSEDGYVRESSQNSGTGGTVSSAASTFRIGDDSSNRAYRPLLSFDTSSLPDNAIVTQATVGITRDGNIVGSVPIGVPDSEFGDILVDLAAPSFGGAALVASDWEALSTQQAVSKFAFPAYLDGMTLFSRLEQPENDLVNTTGRTQYRIRYAVDDDGDSTADYVPYASGDHPNASMRPTLTIQYYVPSTLPGDYDLNGVVDAGDYNTWKANFNGTSGIALLADGNGDGVVNSADYTVWRDNLGASTAAALLESQRQTGADESPTSAQSESQAIGSSTPQTIVVSSPRSPLPSVTVQEFKAAEALTLPSNASDLYLVAAIEATGSESGVEDNIQTSTDHEADATADSLDAAFALLGTSLSDHISDV